MGGVRRVKIRPVSTKVALRPHTLPNTMAVPAHRWSSTPDAQRRAADAKISRATGGRLGRPKSRRLGHQHGWPESALSVAGLLPGLALSGNPPRAPTASTPPILDF
jgi:hypothetical protein